jgi:hypothetical protein
MVKEYKSKVGVLYPWVTPCKDNRGRLYVPVLTRKTNRLAYLCYPNGMGSELDILSVWTDFKPYFPDVQTHDNLVYSYLETKFTICGTYFGPKRDD